MATTKQPETIEPAPANSPPVQPAPTPGKESSFKSSGPATLSAEEAKQKVIDYGATRPDSYEIAIARGEVTNRDGSVVQATKTVVGHILDEAEQEAKKGDIESEGWIELDENGSPVGAATKRPPLNKPAAPVALVVTDAPKIIATPGGAHLTDANMQPSPQTYKYSSPSYTRDYVAIAEHQQKLRDKAVA